MPKVLYLQNLYQKNKKEFGIYVWKKWQTHKNSPLTVILGCVLFCVLFFTAVGVIYNHSEISSYEYGRVLRNAETYDEVPEYGIRLKEYYSDEVITEGEYDKLRSILTDYHNEKAAIIDRVRHQELRDLTSD